MEDDVLWKTLTLTDEQIDFPAVVRSYKIIREFGEIEEEDLTPEFRNRYFEWLIGKGNMQERWIAVEMIFDDCLNGDDDVNGSTAYNYDHLCQRARSIIKRRNEESDY